MDYKTSALDAFRIIEGLMKGSQGLPELADLKKRLEETDDQHELFTMAQTLREILADLRPGNNDVSFKVKNKDGSVSTYKNLAALEDVPQRQTAGRTSKRQRRSMI